MTTAAVVQIEGMALATKKTKIPGSRRAAPGMISWQEAQGKLGAKIDIGTVDGAIIASEYGRRIGRLCINHRGGRKLQECHTCGLDRTCEECLEKEDNRLHVAQVRGIEKGWYRVKYKGKFSKKLSQNQIKRISTATKTECSPRCDGNQIVIWGDGSTGPVMRSHADVISYVSENKQRGFPIVSIMKPMSEIDVEALVAAIQSE